MTTFAEAKGDAAAMWSIIVKIEGVGMYLSSANRALSDGTGQYRFCTGLTTYGDAEPTGIWRDYISRDSIPDLQSERADILGGLPDAGSVTFGIVDVANLLTDTIQPEVNAVARLAEDLTSSETDVTVSDGSQFPAGSVLWCGSEAMAVDSQASQNLTVIRGYLGTEAVPHTDDDLCFNRIPYVHHRRCEVLLVPIDAADNGEEQSLGTYLIDGLDWDETMNVWNFSGASQLTYMHRIVPRKVRSAGRILNSNSSASSLRAVQISVSSPSLLDWQDWTSGESVAGHYCYLQVGKETVEAERANPGLFTLRRRGLAGTQPGDIRAGDPVQQVMVAEQEIPGSFRFSPGASPSESRASGTWNVSAHWVDICLCIMASSSHADDSLELVNYTGSWGNYSSLPVGYGLGMSASLIDWESWAVARDMTPQFTFPNFVLGAKPEPFGELLEREFLRPIGAYVVTRDSTAKVVVPTITTNATTSITIGSDQILRRMVGPGQALPRIEARQNTANLTGTVRYLLGPQKEVHEVNNNTFGDTFGQRGYFRTDSKPVEIEVPGADPTDPNTQDAYDESGVWRLFRIHKPTIGIDVDTDLSIFTSGPGDTVDITLADAPNMAGRGWTALRGEILETEDRPEVNDAGDGLGVYRATKINAWANILKVGYIAPSAYVNDVPDTNDATCDANLYTTSDTASTHGLPTQDVAGFVVNDVVRLVNPDGTSAGGTTETVDAIDTGTNTITLSSNFSGNLAEDTILVYVPYDDSTTQQTDDYVHYADRDGDGDIDESGVAPWVYGYR